MPSWAEGKDAEAVAAKLSAAATAAIDWAARNGVAFDQRKTEAALFSRRRKAAPEAAVTVGDNTVPFNKEATRWLGIWLDSQLTLRERHATRLKNGRNALTRLRRLAGQLGLSPVNCRKVMTACIQSVAMFGAELWWKGEGARRTVGRAEEIQLLVNKQARATTGAFRKTNLGALSMESGLRPAANQLENRQRRFGLRLLSLPQGDRAREVVSAQTAIGNRLATALNYTWTATEETILLEEPEIFDAEIIQEEREEAKKEAEKVRPGLVMFTDGSRLESGAAGYAVAWKNGQTWKGIKPHLGYNQEAFDAECAALARALESAGEEIRPQSELPSLPTRRQRSGGWCLMNRDQDRSTRSKRGNTSPHFEGRGRTSSSRLGGALHTRGWKETKKRTSGPSWQRRSQTLEGWKDWNG